MLEPKRVNNTIGFLKVEAQQRERERKNGPWAHKKQEKVKVILARMTGKVGKVDKVSNGQGIVKGQKRV